MSESEEELKSLLMKVKEEWKSWLKAQHSENEDHGSWSHHFMGNRWGNLGNSGSLYFGGLQNHCRSDAATKLKDTCFLEEKLWPIWTVYSKAETLLANKGLSRQYYGFSIVMYGCDSLDHKESWAPKNWCFWTVVLEKTLQSPLDSSEIKPVHPKGNQSWIFIERTDAEAETPILWAPDA